MNNPLLDSTDLINFLKERDLDYPKLKKDIYRIFKEDTGLDHIESSVKFYTWLHENSEFNKAPYDNGYRAHTHPLFARQIMVQEFPMFVDLHSKISTLSQVHCPYCTRGGMTKSIHILPIDIAPMSQNKNTNNRNKNKKLRAFKAAINHHFYSSSSEFTDGTKLCVVMLFVFGKNETDKDCDNMAKALNDGLNNSLISDDVHIDHLNLMKIKTTFDKSYIIRDHHLLIEIIITY